MSTLTILNGIRDIRASLPTLTPEQRNDLQSQLNLEVILLRALYRQVDGYLSHIDDTKQRELEDKLAKMIADRSVPASAD